MTGEENRGENRGEKRGGIGRGVLEALVLPLLFVGVGLGGAELARAGDPGRAIYPAEMVPSDPTPRQWLVDGFNVVSVALLRDRGSDRGGFWRREHREALRERALAFEDPEAEIWLVFDGRDPDGDRSEAATHTVFASSADDWLLDRVRSSEAPEKLTVVTADRRLANRVRSRGAQVVSPAVFLERCGA